MLDERLIGSTKMYTLCIKDWRRSIAMITIYKRKAYLDKLMPILYRTYNDNNSNN